MQDWVEELAKLNVNKAIRDVLSDGKVQADIIKLNTNAQLYDLGENSLGIKLSAIGGGYSPYTKEIKLAKGQPIDRVTLKDTGDFYATFKVNVFANGDFEIVADPIKDDTNLFQEWGKEIVGLQAKNLEQVLSFVEAAILDEILKGVQNHTPSNLQIA